MRACRLTASSITRRTVLAAAMPWQTRRWQAEDASAKKEGEKTAAEGADAAGAKKETPAANENERITKLEKQLEEKTVEAKDLKDKMVYALADADNARRIAKLDIDKARDFSVTSIAKDMLEVVDTLAKAIEAFGKLDAKALEAAQPVLTGVKMSHQVLVHNLGRHGVEKIPVEKGTKFDPNLHEALFRAPVSDSVPIDHIAAVVKDGYTLKGRVIRAAQVGVAEEQLLQ